MRSRAFVVAVLIAAACSDSGGAATSELAPVATTVAPQATTTTTSAAPAPTATTTMTLPVVPALGIDAGDSFDSDGLSADSGGFVSLDDPVMVAAAEVAWLSDDDVVMGVVHPSGEAHAFPIGQMAYHHIANTTVAGEPYLVTY